MIVIDMDMPTSCCECPICHPKGKDDPWNYACFQGMMDINLDEWDEKRHPNCPIKCDIEQIRAEIEAMMQNVRPFDGMDAVVYTRGFNDGIGSVVDVIDKYTAERR